MPVGQNDRQSLPDRSIMPTCRSGDRSQWGSTYLGVVTCCQCRGSGRCNWSHTLSWAFMRSVIDFLRTDQHLFYYKGTLKTAVKAQPPQGPPLTRHGRMGCLTPHLLKRLQGIAVRLTYILYIYRIWATCVMVLLCHSSECG